MNERLSGFENFKMQHIGEEDPLAHVIIPNRWKFSALLRKFRPFFVFLDGLEAKLSLKHKERE